MLPLKVGVASLAGFEISGSKRTGNILDIFSTHKKQAHCLYITQQMSVHQFISSKVGMHKC